MSDDFDFSDPRPRSWIEAFPWLAGAASGLSVDHWWDEAIDEADSLTRRSRLAAISELAMERLTRWTIGEIFPGLAPDVDLLAVNMPARAVNALARFGCPSSRQLMAVRLEDMLGWRQVGGGTADAILQALAGLSTTFASPSMTAVEPPTTMGIEPPSNTLRPLEWVSSFFDDLRLVATWYATVGQPGRPLISGPVPPESPIDIINARQRLEALTASDILSSAELKLDVAGLFDNALALLDPRAAQILEERLFGDEPPTLDQLGQAHGVTRERIRQVEGQARGAMLTCISEEGPLAEVAASARDLIGTIRPLEDLLDLIPALTKQVESVGQPAWRVLDRLDDAYEIEDGWCVAPSVTAARTMTQAQLQERSNLYGVVRLDDLDLVRTSQPERRFELTAAWLIQCGYFVDGEHVLTRTNSVGDYGAAILSITGSPLSAQEIIDRFVVDRSSGSLRNAMNIDDRFERVDRDQWALKEWGLDAYAGIRSVIREQVARSGGRANLGDLVEYITGRYTVTASSVAAYAGSPPFTCKQGVVRLAVGDRGILKTPERTRRLFRRRDGWAYRIRITTDHLRGSGSVAPVAIASLLDLQFGDTRLLKSPLGVQSVAWTGIQPQFGTIRRFLMDGDIAAGTEVFLVIHDDGTFTFEVTRDLTGNPLQDALALAGVPTTVDIDDARASLTAAIGLPISSPVSSVIGGYHERGDGDIADLLTSARGTLEAGYTPPVPTHRADVDEILDLL